MTMLTLERVSKLYRGGRRGGAPVRALSEVSLTVAAGERLGIVGESGSGKTTLARIVLGLTPASAGRVVLAGRDVSQATAADRRFVHRTVQMVFQDPLSSLNPRKSVRDIVMLPLVAQGVGTRAERRERVRSLLAAVGLPERLLDARPGQLSGGQRQRVGIARALAIRPALLLLDEPTASLDVSVQARVLELLAALHRDTGISQVMISHNLGVIRHAADQVAVMYLGRIVERGPTVRLFAAPLHPYTQALFAAVAQMGKVQTAAGMRGEVASAARIPPGCPFHPRCPAAFDRCRSEEPLPVRTGDGREVRCHLVAGEAVL